MLALSNLIQANAPASRLCSTGDPSTKELPLYGAKGIAVRDGSLQIFGAPRTPTWVHLATTADVNDTTIQVSDCVNWRVNDQVVITSSSFYHTHVDEAYIGHIEWDNDAKLTEIKLVDSYGNPKPLQWTHLGVTSLAGTDNSFDMRAEVTVLTRNVVIQGDEGSERDLFGGHIFVSTPQTPVGRPRAVVQMEQVRLGWGC